MYRSQGTVRRTALLVGCLGLGLVACTESNDDGGATPTTAEPLGPGVVTVPEWFDDPEVLDVSRASEPLPGRYSTPFRVDPGPPILVFAPEDAVDDRSAMVTVSVAEEIDGFGEASESSNGRPAIVGRPFLSWYTACARRGLAVEEEGGRALQLSSPGASARDLLEIADQLRLADDGTIEGTPPSGWTEVGRIAAGWRVDEQASRARLSPLHTALVRRVTGPEAAVFRALMCEDPVADLQPPTSVDSSLYEGQEIRSIIVGPGRAEVGAVAVGEIAAVYGDRLLLVDLIYERTFPDDTAIAALLRRTTAMPASEFAAVLEQADARRADDAVAALVASGVEIVVSLDVDGQRVVVAQSGFGDGSICLGVARSEDGSVLGRSGNGPFGLDGAAMCLPGEAGPGLQAQISSFSGPPLVVADTPVAAAAVVAVDAADQESTAALVDVGGGRRLAIAVVRGVSYAGSYGDGQRTYLRLAGGPVTVRALDAAGVVIAEEVVGVAA